MDRSSHPRPFAEGDRGATTLVLKERDVEVRVVRTRELEDESCIYRALRQAAESADAEVRARAEEILHRGQ